MELIKLMTKYYIKTCSRSFKLAVKNWPVMFALIVYSVILTAAGMLLSRIYLIGGIILAVVSAACASSYLYLIQNIVYSSKVNLYDFKESFKPYLGRVMNIAFYIWIASILLSFITRIFSTLSFGWVINIAITAAAFIMLNPLPEMIYQTYQSEISIFGAAYEFMKENFFEWIIPNIIFGGAICYLLSWNFSLFRIPGILDIIKTAAGLFVVLFSMIYRGILFRFLNESTRRSRLFKLRMIL